MSERIVVLGAGFGGLELATTLPEALGEDARVTLIDKSDAFVFAFNAPSAEQMAAKERFGSSRRARWFGM